MVCIGVYISVEIKDFFNSIFGEDYVFVFFYNRVFSVGRSIVDDRYVFDVVVEGEFSDLMLVFGFEGFFVIGEVVGEDLKGNFCGFVGGLLFGFFVVVVDCGEVVECGGEKECVEFIGEFSIWFRFGSFVGFVVFVEFCVRDVEFEDCSVVFFVKVVFFFFFFKSSCGFSFFIFVLRIGDMVFGWVVGVLGVVDGIDVGIWDLDFMDDYGVFGEGVGFVGVDVCDVVEGFESREVMDDNVGFVYDGDGDDYGDSEDFGMVLVSVYVVKDKWLWVNLCDKRFGDDGDIKRCGVDNDFVV